MIVLLVMLACGLSAPAPLTAISPSPESCLLPPFPTNGSYTSGSGTGVPHPGDEVRRLSVLEYSCGPGYYLTEEVAVCRGNNIWSSKPECKKRCTLYGSDTVEYSCFSDQVLRVICEPAMPHGSFVYFECKTGHTLPDTQILDEMTCIDGSWSRDTPECEAECGLENADAEVSPFITKAMIAPKDSLPWHVAVYQTINSVFTFICGGTIVRPRLVVGAAHCFYDPVNKRPLPAHLYHIAANKHYRDWNHPAEPYVPKSKVHEIRIHTWYTGDLHNYQNDLALVILETPLEFSNKVSPICWNLANKRLDDIQLRPGSEGKFAGWGVTEDERTADELRVLRVPIIDNQACRKEFEKYHSEKYITADKICAGFLNGSTGCNGDSGAGLVFPSEVHGQKIWRLRGVLSVGPNDKKTGECKTNTYTAYTRLFALRDWIKRQLIELSSQREFYEDPPITTPQPVVKRVNVNECALPSYPTHGKFTVTGPNKNLLPGTIVDDFTSIKYSCDTNYDAFTEINAYCEEGIWSVQPPICRKRCPMVQSHSVDFTCHQSGTEMNCPEFLPYGSKIVPTCKPGHEENPNEDLEVLKCVEDGKWDNPIQNCRPDCGLEKPVGGALILNGEIAKKYTFPWHVAIFQLNKINNTIGQICGGSIIHTNLVISAAHCFWDPVNMVQIDSSYYKVAAGKFRRSWHNDLPENLKRIQKSDVAAIYFPKSYGGDDQNQQSDLALLQLTTPFGLTNSVRAICYDLIKENFDAQQTEPGTLGKVAGWGRTDDGEPSEELKTLDLPVIGYTECHRELSKYKFSRYLTNDKLCAGYLNGSALCQGDSGGGLVFPSTDRENNTRWYLRGLVSIGPLNEAKTSCRSNTYTAFTQIFKMRDWLKRTIKRVTRPSLMTT